MQILRILSRSALSYNVCSSQDGCRPHVKALTCMFPRWSRLGRFLRSARSLIQTTGRAARNVDGKVIMYGDKITPSMRQAIDETSRRRAIQLAHNEAHNITPETIKKAVYASIEATVAEAPANYNASTFAGLNKDERSRLAGEIELEMRKASEALEFERAAQLRDMIRELNLPPKKKRKRR